MAETWWVVTGRAEYDDSDDYLVVRAASGEEARREFVRDRRAALELDDDRLIYVELVIGPLDSEPRVERADG